MSDYKKKQAEFWMLSKEYLKAIKEIVPGATHIRIHDDKKCVARFGMKDD